MLIIPVFLLIIGVCIFFECFVKSTGLRIIFMCILLVIAGAITTNIGIKVGKAEQLNRFARLLPQALAHLDAVKERPEELEKAISRLRLSVNDASQLDRLEVIVDEVEQINDPIAK